MPHGQKEKKKKTPENSFASCIHLYVTQHVPQVHNQIGLYLLLPPPSPLSQIGLEWTYELTLVNEIWKKVCGVLLGKHGKRHVHLFTSWMLLGQNMMPKIVLVTMLPKNEAITWENNQVKQIFRAKFMTYLAQNLPHLWTSCYLRPRFSLLWKPI